MDLVIYTIIIITMGFGQVSTNRAVNDLNTQIAKERYKIEQLEKKLIQLEKKEVFNNGVQTRTDSEQ